MRAVYSLRLAGTSLEREHRHLGVIALFSAAVMHDVSTFYVKYRRQAVRWVRRQPVWLGSRCLPHRYLAGRRKGDEVNDKVIGVLDDSSQSAGAVELWFWKHTKHQSYLVDAYDSTARLIQVLNDPGSDLDLLLVDAVLTDNRGGLEALDAAATIRPDVPAVLYSAFKCRGARFMYGLAAAAWF